MRCNPVGPKNAKIAIVGEAPGEQEEFLGEPFVGSSGQELTRMLNDAGIDRLQCYLTNVFLDRPPDNRLQSWFVGRGDLGPGYNLPPIAKGKFLSPERASEVSRLQAEIAEVRPNVTIALGATALWALTGRTQITALRGSVVAGKFGKIIPTFHPAYILRKWEDRLIVVADLMKALRHSESPEYVRKQRMLLINPTIEELEDYARSFLGGVPEDVPISCDVETKRQQITSIAFAFSSTSGVVAPFVDERKPGWHFWSPSDERRAWRVVRRVVEGQRRLIFQNGLYDIQYLRKHGCRPRLDHEDTMIMHHSLRPEMSKSLGFIGSLFLDEPAWKQMRQGKTEKRDE